MFELATKTKMTHIPFRSTAEVVNSMLGGNIDLMLAVKATFGGQVSAGTFRLVAVTSREPSPAFPSATCRGACRR